MVVRLLVELGRQALTAPAALGVDAESFSQIRTGAQRFVAAVEAGEKREVVPSMAPAVSSLRDPGHPATTESGQQVRDLVGNLRWGAARRDAEGRERSIALVADIVDLGTVQAGLLVVAPNSEYPLHHHRPQEFYLVIDGEAEWRFGGAANWVVVQPGEVFYNPPDVWHGLRTKKEPCLALYVLWE